jgi:para-aminobenzoate synthetase component 1
VAPHVVRWDESGKCWLFGLDESVLKWMAERLAGPAEVPDPAAPFRESDEELPLVPRTTAIAPLALAEPFTPAWDADGHRERVQRIKDYIAAGDCYQVNLAVPFRGRFAAAPHRDIAAFTTLMQQSSGPFSAFFRTPGRPSVVSHSPECLLSVRSDHLTSLPIKGTRRRVVGRENELWSELRAAAKDDAELAMIVDLVRNDLGRAAVTGSVQVVDPAVRLDLPYVIHRAARIDARLRPGLTAYDALMASFPAGSITGAPKRRVMEIISELEGGPRGAYCGTFGWIGPGGGDFAVAIRTAEIDGDAITFHAGGGIVWDSDPASEWDEVRAKAAGMAGALGGEV